MEKNILIAGKDLPSSADFAESFAVANYGVVVAGKIEDNNSISPSGVIVAPWNKTSAVSARSLMIHAETVLGSLENVVLYFDAPQFSAQFNSFTIDECPKAMDIMISGFQYLAIEALTRMEQHRHNGKIIFILKTHPTMSDTIHSATLRNSTSAPANPFVAAAEAAFATFAENIIAYTTDKQNISVLLVTGDTQNETMQKDNNLATWLASYLDAYDSLKTKPSAKNSLTWIKAGAKNPGSFSLFK